MSSYQYTHGLFKGKGDIEIYYQGWVSERPRGIVILVHGIGEHSGRYGNIIESLEGKGISVFGLDHRGHGKSKGPRGHINSFMDYVYDLQVFVKMVAQYHPYLPIIMMGHSLGGAIACRYALTYQNDIHALILSGAALIPSVKISAAKRAAGVVFSSILPALTMRNEIDPHDLSHDEDVVLAYVNDPLVHSSVTPRFYTEFTANGIFCLERAEQLRLPLLIVHGGADRLCNTSGSQRVFDQAQSKDKTIEIFPDLYHETMNETLKERNKVISVISKWILAHCTGPMPKASKSKLATIKEKAKPVNAKSVSKKVRVKEAAAVIKKAPAVESLKKAKKKK